MPKMVAGSDRFFKLNRKQELKCVTLQGSCTYQKGTWNSLME